MRLRSELLACQSQQRPELNTALATKPSWKPLTPALKEDIEEQFGEDFSDVRAHIGAVRRLVASMPII